MLKVFAHVPAADVLETLLPDRALNAFRTLFPLGKVRPDLATSCSSCLDTAQAQIWRQPLSIATAMSWYSDGCTSKSVCCDDWSLMPCSSAPSSMPGSLSGVRRSHSHATGGVCPSLMNGVVTLLLLEMSTTQHPHASSMCRFRLACGPYGSGGARCHV